MTNYEPRTMPRRGLFRGSVVYYDSRAPHELFDEYGNHVESAPGGRLRLVPSMADFAPERYQFRAPQLLEASLRAFQPRKK